MRGRFARLFCRHDWVYQWHGYIGERFHAGRWCRRCGKSEGTVA